MTRALRLLHGSAEHPVAVLALHALGLDGDSWDGVARATGHAHAFYVFDQLGHGQQAKTAPTGFDSLVDDAEAALRSVQADHIHLVGHSLGGAVAAHLAAKTQDPRIASVSLIATPAKGMPAFADRAHAVRDQSMTPAIVETLARWFEDTDPDEAVQSARLMLNKMTPQGFDACWHALAEFEGMAQLPQRPLPAQVCSFTQDKSTPPQVGAQVAADLGAIFDLQAHREITGAGHMGILTHHAQVATRLTALWAAVQTHPHQQADAS